MSLALGSTGDRRRWKDRKAESLHAQVVRSRTSQISGPWRHMRARPSFQSRSRQRPSSIHMCENSSLICSRLKTARSTGCAHRRRRLPSLPLKLIAVWVRRLPLPDLCCVQLLGTALSFVPQLPRRLWIESRQSSQLGRSVRTHTVGVNASNSNFGSNVKALHQVST
jgi:hypothetical protein